MKLSYKFFLAFSVTAMVLIILLVGIMQFFAYRNFSDYVNNLEMSKLDDLVRSLTNEYQKSLGWKTLRANHKRWREIIETSIPKDDFNRNHPLPDQEDLLRRHPQYQSDRKRPPLPFPGSDNNPDKELSYRRPFPPPPPSKDIRKAFTL